MLVASLKALVPEAHKGSMMRLCHTILVRSRKTRKILGDIVDDGLRFDDAQDLLKVKKILSGDIVDKELKILSELEKDVRDTEHSVHKALKHEKRLHECLEKVATFAKANRETDRITHKGFLPYESEINVLLDELHSYGIDLPPKWHGRLQQYQNPGLILTRYEILYEKTRRSGIANAIRSEKYKKLHLKVKKFFIDLQKKVNFLSNSIKMNFIGFKNWMQEKMSGGRFEAMTQSTHLASVHISVSNSIKQLRIRHKITDFNQNYDDIERAILSADFKEPKEFYKQEALKSLRRIKKNSKWVDPHSGLTLSEVTGLIWAATNDQNAYGFSENPESDKKDRINTFVEHLWRAHREYNIDESGGDDLKQSVPACLGGTFNKIVESLDRIHPDVTIIRSAAIANDLAAESAQDFYEAHPDQKSLHEAILEDSSDRTPEQQALMSAMKNHVREKLVEKMGTILEEHTVKEILENLEYIQFPEPKNGQTILQQHLSQAVAEVKKYSFEIEEVITWAKGLDQDNDEQLTFYKKAQSLDILTSWLRKLEGESGGLNAMEIKIVQMRFKYSGDSTDMQAIKEHLESTKAAYIKELTEAHAQVQQHKPNP